MKSRLFVSMLVIIIATFAINAQAQRGMRNNMGNGNQFAGKCMNDYGIPFFVMDKLNLTDDQKTEIKSLHFTHQKNQIDAKANLAQLKVSMKELMSAGNVNRSEVLALTDEISAAQAKMHKARTTFMLDVYDLLDDSQKGIWADNMPMMGPKGGFGRGNFGPMGKGNGGGFGRGNGQGRGNGMGNGPCRW